MSAKYQPFYSCFFLPKITFALKTAIRHEKIETYFFAALQYRVYNTGMGSTYRQGYCEGFQGTVYNRSWKNRSMLLQQMI
mgnify:CR=1 FL=1